MRLLFAIVVMGVVAWAAPAGGAVVDENPGCTYADDFSTNAVERDSYAHSAIEADYCLDCWNGWLLFIADSTGNRGLGFYPGQGYGAPKAGVLYRFPEGGGAGGRTGTLEFDLLPAVGATGLWAFASAQVLVSYDDAIAVKITITRPGHYSFDLAAPATADFVEFSVSGSVFRLDDLSVCLSRTVPAGVTTWGRVKALYR